MTSQEALFQGDIAIDGGKIVSLGPVPATFRADQVIDAASCIALPGFVNAHTHLAMVLMRNYQDQGDLFEWLGKIFPIEDQLNADDIYAASLLGAAELIKSGTTAYADMYFQADRTARATKEAGINANIGLTFVGDLADARRRQRELLPPIEAELDGQGQIRIDCAPHAIYTTHGDTYRFAADLARDMKARLNTHVSETQKEVRDSLREFGKTPAMYLDSLGVFDKTPFYLAHGVHLTDEELDMLKDKPCSIVYNPNSNLKLRSGIAPVSKWKKLGINIAMGTDGASSNNNLNILKDLNTGLLANRVSTEEFADCLTPFEILRASTFGGAKALGRETETGTLEVGKYADIQLIDMNQVNTTPMNDPYSALVYSADRENIRTLICRGKVLMQDRRLLTLDEESIKKQVRETWKNVQTRL